MDRTSSFFEICHRISEQENKHTLAGKPLRDMPLFESSPFLLEAKLLLQQIETIRNKLCLHQRRMYGNFFDFSGDHHLECETSDQNTIMQEFRQFMTCSSKQVEEMKKHVQSNSAHHQQVILSLASTLFSLESHVQQMKAEEAKYNQCPIFLFSKGAARTQSIINATRPKNIDEVEDRATGKPAVKRESLESKSMPKLDFASRYTSAVAPLTASAKYSDFVQQHKMSLFNEENALKEKFRENAFDIDQIEQNISNISSTLLNFVEILQSQKSDINDVHSAAKETTSHMEEANEELVLALERSRSHNRSMLIVTLALAVILLLLDFITP